MKCPFCNFLNSNTRDHCLRCDADLTELKQEFGLSETRVSNNLNEKSETQENDLLKAPIPKTILKTSSEAEISSLQSRISNIRSGLKVDSEMNEVSSHQKQAHENETASFEDNTVESSISQAEVQELITETKSKTRIAVSSSGADEEFQIRFLNISYELEKRMEHWRKILDPKIELAYNELINSFPHHSDEFEMGQHTQLSGKKKNEINQLYDLQIKEIVGKRSSKKEYQKSHSRTLERNKLDKTYKELKTDLLTTQENKIEKESEEEISNLPVPESRTILISFAIDLIVVNLSTAAFIAILPIVKNKLLDLDSISKSIITSLDIVAPSAYLLTFIAAWFTLSFFFTIFNHGSIGQNIMGLKISTLNGGVPNFSSLFKRFFAQLFNILTFGIRLIIQLKSKNGLTCKFSNTRLTYSAFIN